MKRILVTSAGGSPAANFTRSLRKAPEAFWLVGTDSSKYHLMRAETDKRYVVPPAHDPHYIDCLNRIIEEEQIDLVHAQSDPEVSVISEYREKLSARTFLPAKETVRICQDKYQSFQRWRNAGLRVPGTMIIRSPEDLRKAFETYGGKVWLRAIAGAGGRGSLPAHSFEGGRNWLDLQNGWGGDFTAAEMLEPESTTWMSIWHDGELVVAQGRKRLYWELSRTALSGVTGATGAGVTIADPEVDDISQRAVLAVDGKPDGLFGVDLTFDKNRVPNPTEINIGRFFTTHHFFTELGLNMPYIYVKLAYQEEPPPLPKRLNPLPDNMVWIRGIDFEPVLVPAAEIEAASSRSEQLFRRGQCL